MYGDGWGRSIKGRLADVGAIVTNSHFVYSKGELGPDRDHGSDYINKDIVTAYPTLVHDVAGEIAYRINRLPVEAIASPAVAGALFGQSVAFSLSASTGREINFVYLDKDGGDGLVLKRRGFPELVRGRRVAVVEDVLNSGGTARETVQVVRAHGGEVVLVAAMANRGGVTAQSLGVSRLETLIDVPMPKYPSNNCPLCKEGHPVRVDLGHGREFLQSLPVEERKRLAPRGYMC
jgi:orotate phosphoribosyltransferase